MTDPAVAYLPSEGYSPYDNGKTLDVWLKAPNGSESLGLVWPGRYFNYYTSYSFVIINLAAILGVTVFPGK